MEIHVIAIGKIKTAGYPDCQDYYIKKIRNWAQTEIHELKASQLATKSTSNRLLAQAQEAARIQEFLDQHKANSSQVFLLDETGKARDTLEWARLFNDSRDIGQRKLFFCLGGSTGFLPEFLERFPRRIQFGRQTLCFELARIVLLEQIYRSLSLLNGHPYHNATENAALASP